jgi:hypothetical protein
MLSFVRIIRLRPQNYNDTIHRKIEKTGGRLDYSRIYTPTFPSLTNQPLSSIILLSHSSAPGLLLYWIVLGCGEDGDVLVVAAFIFDSGKALNILFNSPACNRFEPQ